MPRLTITIPTYNRSKALAETVSHLLPQLTAECKLVIVDNASETPASEVLRELLAQYSALDVQVLRNKYNVGMCGNFMRCFEVCDTEWLWILGDDEAPSPDAITKIFRQVDAHPDCVFHNFTCPTLRTENGLPSRENSTVSIGVEDFVRKLDHFSSIQFIPLNVYRAPSFLPHFSVGCDYAYSLHNFVAMLLKALEGDRRACFSSEALIPDHGGLNKAWGRIRLGLVSGTLLDLPLPSGVRAQLREKISRTFFPLKSAATVLLSELIDKKRSKEDVQYIFYQTCARSYYYEASVATRIRIAIYKLLFRFPRFSTHLIRVPALKGMLFDQAYVWKVRDMKDVLKPYCPNVLVRVRRKFLDSFGKDARAANRRARRASHAKFDEAK